MLYRLPAKVWINDENGEPVLVMDDNDRHLTDHFQLWEVTCKHCGEVIEDDLLIRHMNKLEELRVLVGFPITITSGHRCEVHNKAEGGAPSSMHLKFATDVMPKDPQKHSAITIHQIATEQDWGGIGLYENPPRVHLDLREIKARWTGV